MGAELGAGSALRRGWVEFADPEHEAAFRSATRAEDLRTLRWGCLIGACFVLAFALADFLRLGASEPFFRAFVFRLAIAGCFGLAYWLAVRAPTPAERDAVVAGFLAVILVTILAGIAIFAPSQMTHGGQGVLGMVVIFMLIPMRLSVATFMGAFWTVGVILVLAADPGHEPHIPARLMVLQVVVLGIGYLVAARLAATRRLHFAKLLAEQALRRALAREVEERRTAEAEMRIAMERADEAMKAKSRFFSAMSHEMRTPLTSVLGYCDLLRLILDDPGPLDRDSVRQHLETIARAGEHLLSLINDVLDLAKLESGRMELALLPLSVDEVVAEALTLIRPAAADAGIVIATADVQGLGILADRRAVRQMLLNLLSNAVKFTPDGGRVGLEAWKAADGGTVIAVRDAGPGMTPEGLRQALEPFGSGGTAAQPGRQSGTGLGLPLVKAMVEAHAGRLEFESSPGRGTLAMLAFPPVAD